ncbi:MAG: hypothetical protein BWY09_02775 [Candidatus Hydrogenedentes bacterium ADurb.Bin179]|nr:MAG: hypothetical protein BWY09_02775 [Candidatus Hydrogenedentes bacterium ADurb.Bin179]
MDFSGEPKDRPKKARAAGSPVGAPAAAPANGASGAALGTGDVIQHVRFGRGVVLSVKGAGLKLRARVRFDSGRVADLLAAQAPIEIIKRR